MNSAIYMGSKQVAVCRHVFACTSALLWERRLAAIFMGNNFEVNVINLSCLQIVGAASRRDRLYQWHGNRGGTPLPQHHFKLKPLS
jgi:hypothetical protein